MFIREIFKSHIYMP